VLVVRGCQTPELADVSLALAGPDGAVAGKVKQLEQVTSLPKSSGSPPYGRDGRLVLGFVPEAPLSLGASYVLSVVPKDAAPSTHAFTVSAPLGVVAAPAVEAKVVAKLVPTRVCCQGASGCGGGGEADPYPAPAPVVDTVEPVPIGRQCEVVATTAAPEIVLSFPFVTPKAYVDYRLFDDKDNVLAYFAGRRLPSGLHALRVAEGESRCFRVEAEDRLSGAKASTNVCAGPANVDAVITSRCDTIDRDRFSSCDPSNLPILASSCDGSAGSSGSGGAAIVGGSGGAATVGGSGGAATVGGSGGAAAPTSSPDEGGCQVSALGPKRGGFFAGGLALLAFGGWAARKRAAR
jgi:hypothetical protein